MDREAMRATVVDRLKKVAAPRYADLPITDATEVYYDLRISGMDMQELLHWLSTEFGVDMRINVSDYTPPEGWDPFFFRQWRLRRRPYKSLTVGDILKAIEVGR